MSELVFLKAKEFLCCPKCRAELDYDSVRSFLTCRNHDLHSFPIIEGIPSFVKREEISPKDAKWIFEYDEKAGQYDELVKMYDVWLGVNLGKEFRKLVEQLPIESARRILDVSTGTGAMIIGIKEVYPNVAPEFVGIDLSIGMLFVAQRKFIGARMDIPLFHSQVKELPFKDESFDIVTHAGGINTFEDIPATLREWVRVLRPEGILFLADEGLSPAARKTLRGVEIVKANRLFGLMPPLDHLPPQIKNVELRWFARDTFYSIKSQKLSQQELRALKTEGTEHIRIIQMVEEYLKSKEV